MTVRFSADVEKDELEARKKARSAATWEFYRSGSLVEIVHKARDLGWGDKKVQVRREVVGQDSLEFVIEPFEKDCGCSGILKYDDFFLRPDRENIMTESTGSIKIRYEGDEKIPAIRYINITNTVDDSPADADKMEVLGSIVDFKKFMNYFDIKDADLYGDIEGKGFILTDVRVEGQPLSHEEIADVAEVLGLKRPNEDQKVR